MKNKKKIIFTVIICSIIVLSGIISCVFKYRSRDHINFAKLDMSQIDSVLLYSYSKQTVILSEREAEELIPLLNKVELAGEWTQEFRDEYVGVHSYMFRINLRNGKSFDFSACTPFYIIDGERGYKVGDEDFDACYELDNKYLELVDKYFY